jgi:streptomycin 6-kinase
MPAAPIGIPSRLARTIAAEGPLRAAWLAALPDRVADLAGRWRLRLGDPYEPGGNCAWVAPVLDEEDRPLVLKVGWTHTEGRDEAEGLAVFGGQGAVQVHAFEHDGDTTSLLLERCVPGAELRTRPEPEQDEVIADLLLRLWSVRIPEGHPFRPLVQMCDEWGDEAEHKLAAAPAVMDPGLARAGLLLFRELPRSATRSALLCTDLHAGNVLSGQRRPWLLIDPKPYVGDPHYDITQHLLNCQERLRDDPDRLVRRMSDLTGLDTGRAREWTFARCVQEGVDSPQLEDVARQLAR